MMFRLLVITVAGSAFLCGRKLRDMAERAAILPVNAAECAERYRKGIQAYSLSCGCRGAGLLAAEWACHRCGLVDLANMADSV